MRAPAKRRPVCRADLLPGRHRLPADEINMGSTAGGGDNAVLTRAFLSHIRSWRSSSSEPPRAHRHDGAGRRLAADRVQGAQRNAPGGAAADWPPATRSWSRRCATRSSWPRSASTGAVPCRAAVHPRRAGLVRPAGRRHLPVFMIEICWTRSVGAHRSGACGRPSAARCPSSPDRRRAVRQQGRAGDALGRGERHSTATPSWSASTGSCPGPGWCPARHRGRRAVELTDYALMRSRS
jgi:hypothetical protein